MNIGLKKKINVLSEPAVTILRFRMDLVHEITNCMFHYGTDWNMITMRLGTHGVSSHIEIIHPKILEMHVREKQQIPRGCRQGDGNFFKKWWLFHQLHRWSDLVEV